MMMKAPGKMVSFEGSLLLNEMKRPPGGADAASVTG